MGELSRLRVFFFHNNQLPEIYGLLKNEGVESLKSYLRSLKDAKALFEAKLLLVGEGAVGKSSLLAAMLGEDFIEKRKTTHGIDIKELPLPHPILPEALTLNAWDFGGQPVYRISHQFFYSSRSLFLLLWNPRLGPEQCEVHGWIERIRLRVGDKAKILIVATHRDTGERVARIGRDELLRDHGDVIVDFYDVDSETNTGIEDQRR